MNADVRAARFDSAVVTALLACVLPRETTRVVAPLQDDEQALSPRELQVLRHVSQGDNTKQIARALDISPRTVRTHVERVFHKLNCSTRAAATLKASTRGLI
jgi:DNA-binding NarL/FixJ family response regulator